MCARARERYTADRKSRFRRRRKRHAELPNLIIIGGLKCGTTSIHHYLGLHPEIQMSKPKELNFFVEELNWDLGLDWYASRFDDRFEVRGESSPHYTNLPRFQGVAERIQRALPRRPPASTWCATRSSASSLTGSTRPAPAMRPGEMVPTLSEPDSSYVHRSMYWMQLQPYLELFDRSQIEIITQEELQTEREETMRKAFRFAGVDENFTSEQFDREWEKSSAKQGDKYQLMERLIKLPGLRSFDRNFDRLPESMRWIVERVVHDPEKPPAPKPKLPDDLFETVRGSFRRGRCRAAGVRRPRVRRLARLLLRPVPEPCSLAPFPSPVPWPHSRAPLLGPIPEPRSLALEQGSRAVL